MRGLLFFLCGRLSFPSICSIWGILQVPNLLWKKQLNAVGWVHQLAGFPPVADSSFVRMVRLAKPKVRKEPITKDMITTFVGSLGPAPTLTDVRLVAACLLAFSGFLRYYCYQKWRAPSFSRLSWLYPPEGAVLGQVGRTWI